MRKFSFCVCCLVVVMTGPGPAPAQLKVMLDEKNAVASRLEGDWKLNPELTRRLGGPANDVALIFKNDPAVVKLVPEKIKELLQKERIYMAGWIRRGGGKKGYPFFLLALRGNPTIIWLRHRGDEPYGNPESFLIAIAVGSTQADDILFVGQESIPRPFSAYDRAKKGNLGAPAAGTDKAVP